MPEPGSPDPVIDAIHEALNGVEATHDVRILLAVESGSRAWGFASSDSDWDVRFLFVRRRDRYLAVESARVPDVIEPRRSDDLDLVGWDLRKALRLLGDGIRLSMARGNRRESLKGDVVWRKKYLYVLRPLLALRWIETRPGPVPLPFDTLLAQTLEHGVVADSIQRLVAAKRSDVEMGRGPAVPEIDAFIDAELTRHAARPPTPTKTRISAGVLDKLFLDALAEAGCEAAG